MLKTFVLFILIVSVSLASAQTHPDTVARKKHLLTDTVGVVNGVLITLRDFKSELRRTMKLHIAEIKNATVTDTQYTVFVNETWDKMVADVIVEQEIKKLGLEINDVETVKRILKTPPELLKKSFTDTSGVFHPEAMKDFLTTTLTDTLRDNVVRYYRLQFQQDGLINAIAPKARTDSERRSAIAAWIQKRVAKSNQDDRRTAFGFY